MTKIRITKIDCEFPTAESISSGNYNFVSFSFIHSPGTLILAATPKQETMSEQIASNLALQYFSEYILEYSSAFYENLEQSVFLNLLQDAVNVTNESLYDFGSKMGSTGSIKTSFLACIITRDSINTVRIGSGNIVLSRADEIYSFFEDDLIENNTDYSPKLLGEEVKISPELASIKAESLDFISLFTPYFSVKEIKNILSNSYISKFGEYKNDGKDYLRISCRLGPKAIFLE